MSQQINLFNPAFAREKKIFTAATMLNALGVLLFGCLALYGYGKHSVGKLEQQAREGEALLEQKKTRLAAVMLEFAPRKKSKELEDEIAEAQAELASLNKVVTVLARGDFGDTAGFAPYFKALARQSNGEVWLTGLSIANAGKRIGLQGRTLEASLVPAYVGRLTREPVMRGKSFGSLDITRPSLSVAGSNGAPASETAAPFLEFSLQAAASDSLAPAQARTQDPAPVLPTGPAPVAPLSPAATALPAALGKLLPPAAGTAAPVAPAAAPAPARAPGKDLL